MHTLQTLWSGYVNLTNSGRNQKRDGWKATTDAEAVLTLCHSEAGDTFTPL